MLSCSEIWHNVQEEEKKKKKERRKKKKEKTTQKQKQKHSYLNRNSQEKLLEKASGCLTGENFMPICVLVGKIIY